MNYKAIIRVTGIITLIISLIMLLPLFVSFYYEEWHVLKAFVLTIIPLSIIGGVLVFSTKSSSTGLRLREGVFIVSECWILASLFGAMPYLLSGVSQDFVSAFFESASGFSTTGATLLDKLTELPVSLLFWRSFTHWLGGMGILVFAISILPALGIGAISIARTETTGPSLDKMRNRISDSVKTLYIVFFSLSLAEMLLLIAGRMPFIEALMHTFSSMGTGGLTIIDSGNADYNLGYIEFIIALFSIFASVNFINYDEMIRRKWKDFFMESEFRAYLTIILSATLFFTVVLRGSGVYASLSESLRQGFNQVSAVVTSSGYATADYTIWPPAVKWTMFGLMIIGGCSSSTAGGVKIIRVLVMLRTIARNFNKRIHPRAVVSVKLSGRSVSAENVSNIAAFILMYSVVLLGSTLLLAMDGVGVSTAASAAASVLSNNGLGFGDIGCTSSFSVFSAPGRLFLSLLMIIGRLELFTFIILFTPSYWRTERR